MSQALYRKYRPTTFKEVVNQNHVKTVLENEVKAKNIAHAYLFAGPRGVGKTTIARIFAKSLNEKVIRRHALNDTTLLDIIEIDAASHTGVDHVREHIIQNALVAPSQLEYKVFIIDEVHMLSASAFNALLKILEEPPAHVVFILATTEVHRLPATVISRCQRFDFHTIPLADIVKRLEYICTKEKVQVDEAVLQRIARKASGAIRDAESMLGQLLSLNEKRITEKMADVILPKVDMTVVIELFEHLVARRSGEYLQTLHNAVQNGMHMKEAHTWLIECIRQSLLYSIDHNLEHFATLDIHERTHQRLLRDMQQFSTQDGLRLLDLFLGTADYFAVAPLPQLPLELAGVRWCEGGKQQPSTIVAPIHPIAKKEPAPSAKKIQVKKSTLKISPQKVSTAPTAPLQQKQADALLLQSVQHLWPTIIRRMKDANHALAMALSVAHVAAAYKPNIVHLGFRYDFHRERVSQYEHFAIVQTIISEAVGREIVIECIVGAQYEIDLAVLQSLPSDNIAEVNPPETENVWDLALHTLRGKDISPK